MPNDPRQRDWNLCQDVGVPKSAPIDPAALSRRGLLVTASLAAAGLAASRSALAGVTFAPEGHVAATQNVLVVVFLRGGADGLSVAPPYFEDAYHRARPNLRLGAPSDKAFSDAERAIRLDDRFGLHPALAPIGEIFRQGKAAVVQAVGSFDTTRSHFEAMSAMERGLANDGEGPSDGWLARHLSSTARPSETPLRAVSFGTTMPDSLRGALNAISLSSISDYRLRVDEDMRARLERELAKMYGTGKDAASHAGNETLKVLQAVRGIDLKTKPKAEYPETGLGNGLRETARLIHGKVGLEVACLDMGGWDTHVTQGTGIGWMPTLLTEVGNAVGAFVKDLGPAIDRTTIVVMSEFGRRVAENQALGTDHGRAGALFVLGGGVRGGKVYTDWPGLTREILDGPGDLPVTTDYRAVLAEILAARLGAKDMTAVFPGFNGKPLGITM